ncbi:MAG: hypothetical protein WBA93_09495 [Microcoleaceae cyanobacterium]
MILTPAICLIAKVGVEKKAVDNLLLAIKLNVLDLPEKTKENYSDRDVNELVAKEVISPQKLDFN